MTNSRSFEAPTQASIDRTKLLILACFKREYTHVIIQDDDVYAYPAHKGLHGDIPLWSAMQALGLGGCGNASMQKAFASYDQMQNGDFNSPLVQGAFAAGLRLPWESVELVDDFIVLRTERRLVSAVRSTWIWCPCSGFAVSCEQVNCVLNRYYSNGG